VADISELKPT
jgi:NAD(P)-dependent dehydrogenase (short-subunit alcohol dehydrogenase family)